jgi:hypothetical protein
MQYQVKTKIICKYRLIIYFFICVFSACAYQPSVTPDLPSATADTPVAPHYWWSVKYRIRWDEFAGPDYYLDLLLADAVIEPILTAHRNAIVYWRFHRRAVRDNAGHQFSFIFYSDKNTAQKIYQLANNNKITQKLLVMNILEKILTDDLDKNTRTAVNATSDRNWPVTLQNAWPAYIMGVSDTWLQLINQETNTEKQDNNINILLSRYKRADSVITKLWFEEGNHAFLHHLNAVFGYQPVFVDKPLQF